MAKNRASIKTVNINQDESGAVITKEPTNPNHKKKGNGIISRIKTFNQTINKFARNKIALNKTRLEIRTAAITPTLARTAQA